MKNITMSLILLLVLPALLQAQYFGGDGNGDASIGLTNVPISVHRISMELPTKYELFQNYPNPFNPETKIRFDIPENFKFEISNLKLVVYDILGKEVVMLVNETLQPGTYEVTFDGSNLPSGIYFYRIVAGDFTAVKRMVLIK